MKKIFLFPVLFVLAWNISLGQSSDSKIMFIIDSIPVLEDPEEGNDILSADVADITVIKNKDSLQLLGYGQFDGATFLFTKEYRNRAESIKQIPSSKQMKRINQIWHFHNTPYNGSFIDYYYSGRKQGEGTLLNGQLNGNRKIYFQNGRIVMETNYTNGLRNGLETEYFEDGSLKQKGVYTNGKEEGIWESYFPNGQVNLRSKYKNGEVYDTSVKYYSTGKIKERVFIKNGKVTDLNLAKINQLMAKSSESNRDGDHKAAIKYCSKAIELDSTYAPAYFSRGTIKLNDFQFDEAIVDFDNALRLEPFMDAALVNRAFARIRKYQFGNSRTLSKNNEVTVLASKDKVAVPENEREKICDDLQQAVFLGSKSKMITEARSNYCK